MSGWRQKRRDTRAYRIENGLCVRCGEPAEDGYTQCAEHRENARVNQARSAERHRERLAEQRRAKEHAEEIARAEARRQAETEERIAESERTGSLIPMVKRKSEYGELGRW